MMPQQEIEERENYEKLWNSKKELHKLLRRVIVSTKLGRQDKSQDDLYLSIGNGELNSCMKYEQVRFCIEESQSKMCGEYQLDNDYDSISYLTREVKKRFAEFQKDRDSHKIEYIKAKKKFAAKHFGLPLNIRLEGAKE